MKEENIVLLFLGCIVLVGVLTFSAIVRILLRRFGYLSAPTTFEVWLRRIAFTSAVAGLLCILYGRFVEPYWLSVTYNRIETPKLPTGMRPLRIVHISDLHSDPEPRLEEQLPERIAEQHPDIIVFTGDTLNTPKGLPIARKCLSRLAEIAPTFVVRGNWDAWYWRNQDLFGATGVRELAGDAGEVTINGFTFYVAGAGVGDEKEIGTLLDGLPPDAFKVFLYHYPDEIMTVAAHGADLYCAGHTHGGQVALPFYGALITLSKFGKRFEAGLYKVQNTWLYVNRGIGMEGGTAPRVRFFARPEITVIEVAPMTR